MTKHSWRPPAPSRNKSGGPKPDNSWLKFVHDSHLEWLMDMVDRVERGEVLDDEDSEHYAIIKEQALTFMARAKAENWTEADKSARMLAWQSSTLAGRL